MERLMTDERRVHPKVVWNNVYPFVQWWLLVLSTSVIELEIELFVLLSLDLILISNCAVRLELPQARQLLLGNNRQCCECCVPSVVEAEGLFWEGAGLDVF